MFQTKRKMVGVFEVFFFFLCNLPATRPLQSACNTTIAICLQRDHCKILIRFIPNCKFSANLSSRVCMRRLERKKCSWNLKRSLAVKCVAGYITFTEVKKKINRQTLGFVGIFSSFRKRDIRGVESSTISSINFSILGSNKRFFDKLYGGSWSESSIYIPKIT